MIAPKVLTTCFKSVLFGTCLVLLSACNGGGKAISVVANTSNASVALDQSPLLISLTDAEGDFLQYQVAVTSINLVKENQATVSVMSRSTVVDFARYVEVSELLTALDVPAGRYQAVSLSLDFSQAQILIQNQAGEAVSALAVNAAGEPLGETTLTVEFSDRDGFVLFPGVARHLALDFDLDASNTIEYDGDLVKVVVDPVIITDTLLSEVKPMRVRGLTESVDLEAQKIDVLLRPFRHRQWAMGKGSIYVTEATEFEVDGESLTMAEALTKLAGDGAGTALVAEGDWQKGSRKYVASRVHAGRSVPWGEMDVVRGTVIARDGMNLTLRAASAELADGRFRFCPQLSVQLSSATQVRVVTQGEGQLQHISVGSSVLLTGVMTQTGFDASAGFARIYPSFVSGIVVSASPLVIDANLLNGVRASVYDMANTGISSVTDADIDFYEIDRQGLSVQGVDLGDPIRVRGFAQEFGAAPEDFIASTLFNQAGIRAHMVVNYGSDSAENVAINDHGLALVVDSNSSRHHIVRAGIPFDLSDDMGDVELQPWSERGVYTLAVTGQVRVFTYYQDFSEALDTLIAQGAKLQRVDAYGEYDNDLRLFKGYRCRILVAR